MKDILQTVLAIESTCDDSSVAVVSEISDGSVVVQCMLTYTQGMHSRFGGVVPEYASRGHAQWLPVLIEQLQVMKKGDDVYATLAVDKASGALLNMVDDDGKSLKCFGDFAGEIKIDAICVASNPGLPGSLVCGVTVASMLGGMYDLPVVEVNHIMGHLFSPVLDRKRELLQLPYLCLTVSGGHSDVYVVEKRREERAVESSHDDEEESIWHKRGHLGVGESVHVGMSVVTKLVQTMDDAVGEAFDKVAKLLGGPYPGGPWIDQQAASYQQGMVASLSDEEMNVIKQRIKKIDVGGQFSFSGIKGQVVSLLAYYKRNQKGERGNQTLSDEMVAAIAWQFQDRVTTALVDKLEMMIEQYKPEVVGIVGGVSANSMLQKKIAESDVLSAIRYCSPAKMAYCGDNAAMIGVVGLMENEISMKKMT